jgi:hypothetical protein
LRTIKALKDAIITLLSNCAHLVVNAKTVKQAWVLAYTATYKAELRPESKDRPKELVEAQLEYFERAGTAAMNELGLNINHSEIISSKAAWTWRLRSVWGKTLNLLRLIKAAFTYKGGINYIKWKLQRHWKAKT